jgi:hypothetical protein
MHEGPAEREITMRTELRFPAEQVISQPSSEA